MARDEVSAWSLALQTDRMITLAPEDSDKTFQVPRSLLDATSEWFTKALDKRFKEGQDGVLKLLDTNTDTIENFLYWMYNHRSPFTRSPPAPTDDGEEEDAHRVAAIQLWAFGDKHFIPKLQDIALRALEKSMEKGSWPSLHIIQLGYTVSAGGSELRRLLSAISVEGLKVRMQKSARRRHARRSGIVVVKLVEGYDIAEFEQIEDTPGLLIDILKVYVGKRPSDAEPSPPEVSADV